MLTTSTRILLTAAGAALLAVAAFRHWTRDFAGLDLNWRALYQDTFSRTPDSVLTLGALGIGLGMLALLGLADPSGWLTRIAGVAAAAGLVMFVIQVQRSGDHSLHLGYWLAAGGAVACVVAGFAGHPARITVGRSHAAAPVPVGAGVGGSGGSGGSDDDDATVVDTGAVDE